MNHHPSIIRLAFVTVVSVTSVLPGLAQNEADQWLRVVTDEESIIDVNRSSLVIEQNQVISAKFRTSLSKPESVPGKSDIKYLTRLDSIMFSVKDGRYRVFQSNLLDESGRVVLSYASREVGGWKPLWSRTGGKLFSAARQLPPFGIWRVISYRYASGDVASDRDPPELTSLVGSDIWLTLDRVVAGKETCYAPIFDAKTVTNEEFDKLVGSPIKSLGIQSDKVEAILVVCDAKGQTSVLRSVGNKPIDNFPSQTIILRLSGNKALMLWEGVFLELERPGNRFLP